VRVQIEAWVRRHYAHRHVHNHLFRLRGSGSGFRIRVRSSGSGFRIRVRGSGSGFKIRVRSSRFGSGLHALPSKRLFVEKGLGVSGVGFRVEGVDLNRFKRGHDLQRQDNEDHCLVPPRQKRLHERPAVPTRARIEGS
jgi:hypothetical protein